MREGKTVIVYHGTGLCSVMPILMGDMRLKPRVYLKKPSFSTTTDLNVATLFASRKTPAIDFMAGKITGVVIEFELLGTPKKDYIPTRDPMCFLEEQEIAIFRTECLTPVATWTHQGNRWIREVAKVD